jgi:hypothetical protein
MKKIVKSIVVSNESDYSIVKHHIASLDLEFECKFKETNIIDFYDDYLYGVIKEFLKHTHIKSKINKDKEKEK